MVGDITIASTDLSDIAGFNAATATILQTTRKIGNVDFNGSADIIPEKTLVA